LKQTTKDDRLVEAKNLMQTREKFCEVCALKFASFPLSTKSFGVICRPCKYFYRLRHKVDSWSCAQTLPRTRLRNNRVATL